MKSLSIKASSTLFLLLMARLSQAQRDRGMSFEHEDEALDFTGFDPMYVMLGLIGIGMMIYAVVVVKKTPLKILLIIAGIALSSTFMIAVLSLAGLILKALVVIGLCIAALVFIFSMFENKFR